MRSPSRRDIRWWLPLVALLSAAAGTILLRPAHRTVGAIATTPASGMLAWEEASGYAAPKRAKPWPRYLTDESWRRYVSKGTRGRIVVAWSPDGRLRVTAIDPTTGRYETAADVKAQTVRVSPDARTLAYTGSGGLWALAADGKAQKVANIYGGFWGAGGKEIIGSKGERIRPDGSSLAPLPVPEGDNVEDASLDGRWLVIGADRNPRGGSEQLYLLRANGGERRALTESGRNFYGRLSPDARRLVYTRLKDLGATTRTPEEGVWVVGTDGRDRRQLLAAPNQGNNLFACWSPDGKAIAVLISGTIPDRTGHASPIRRIQIIDPRGRKLRAFDLPGGSGIPDLDWR